MELRHLDYFVAVAEEASFTRAAARVHVAQPGVSAQIRQLEAELGQPLFDRSGRTVRLTAAGEAVLPYARAALEAVTGARHAVDELTGLLRGHVAMGVITGCATVDLADMLAEFHGAHPGVEIALSEDTSDRLLDALQAGAIDLAYVGLAAAAPPGIETQVVVDEALVAAVPPDDPLAGWDASRWPPSASAPWSACREGPACVLRWTLPVAWPVSSRASPSRRVTWASWRSSPCGGSAWRCCRSRWQRHTPRCSAPSASPIRSRAGDWSWPGAAMGGPARRRGR